MLDVIYDGRCGFCVRSLNVCRALASADFENAMFVVAPDRRVARGFFAFRRMLWESPLMWPLLLPFYVPGSGWIGPRVYAWVARNRRTLGCESDVCERPPTPPSSRNPRD
jgi:predicted DCC family thiol-disulfide oxidoreductase YuxK